MEIKMKPRVFAKRYRLYYEQVNIYLLQYERTFFFGLIRKWENTGLFFQSEYEGRKYIKELNN